MKIQRMNSRVVLIAILSLTTCNANEAKQTEEQCTYTFTVPRQSDTACPTDGQDDSRVSKLEHVITQLQSQLQLHSELFTSTLKQLKQVQVHGNMSVGTSYVRWGRTVCPETAELVYEGYTGRAYFSDGGGGDYQCLPRDPEWPAGAEADVQSKSHMFGVEYEKGAGFPEGAEENDAPCAVCNVEARTRQIMIPGKLSCPSGWTEEYEGWLVAQRYDEASSTFACLDYDFEYIEGGSEDDSGGVFYQVEAWCGPLPCPPYEHGMELSCVVCTK